MDAGRKAQLVVGGLVAAVVLVIAGIMITDAVSRSNAREHNQTVHDSIVNGGNASYSQQQLNNVCQEYPEAC